MDIEKDEIQEWLDKGNKIKVLPYYEPKNVKMFIKFSNKAKRRNVTKGSMK